MVSATRELLADRYHLEERLATGGMGVVWRARDHRLARDVAIKLIRPEYADDPTFRQRLELEARSIAAINSPHVVRIHDVCEERDPAGGYRSFLVMELVDGQPLSAILRDGAFTAERAADVTSQVAAALAAAHERQIIHRDIKPANVMVDANGRVTVLDFGIARAADTVALTATDLILGTARYISPEQADGRGATAASDVYALGVVAFECLTGSLPYDVGSDVSIALAHLRDPIPALPPNVPEPIASLVRQMLAKAPADRPTAAEVAARLGAPPEVAPADVAPTDAAPTGAAAAAATIRIPEAGTVAGPEPTALMPAVMAASHRVRDALAGRDLKDTRSAAVQPRLLAVPVALVLLALILALAVSGGGSPRAHAAAGTKSSHATHHAVAKKVTIDPTLYLGQSWPAVRAALTALGVKPVPEFAGHGPDGTVVGMAPTGKVAKGAVVTVVVTRSGPQPPPQHKLPKPKPKPKPHHVPPGQAKKDHREGGD